MLGHVAGDVVELLWRSFLETLVMTGAAGAISLAAGLPLGLLLVATDKGGIWERPAINRVLGGLVNAARSVPFIILLVAAIPLTRVIVGTSIGVAAAIVPLSLAAIPYYARIAEVSLREVEPGLIEAARAMGGNRWTIIREVLIPESLPGLISGFTVTLVTFVGASAMAGAVGFRRPRRHGDPLRLPAIRDGGHDCRRSGADRPGLRPAMDRRPNGSTP